MPSSRASRGHGGSSLTIVPSASSRTARGRPEPVSCLRRFMAGILDEGRGSPRLRPFFSARRAGTSSRKLAPEALGTRLYAQETASTGAKRQPMDESFWDANGDWISALITLAIALAIAFLVDRFVIHYALRHARRVSDLTVSRAATTRLRLVRRLLVVVIIGIGFALALSQFNKFDRLAT